MSAGQLWQKTLSSRQAEIIELIAKGLTNKQIGLELFISERTVKWHIAEALNKIDGGSGNKRVMLAHWWWENVELPALQEGSK